MVRTLALGYVFNLDFSAVPNGEDMTIKDRRYKPLSNARQVKLALYGEVQTGVITFSRDGASLDDWFGDYKGLVGEAPRDFDLAGANDGNPAVKWSRDDNTLTLELGDGFVAQIGIRPGEAWIEEASHDYSVEEATYLLRTARLLTAPD